MNRFAAASAVLVLASAATCAHAQMPTDNDSWKARCSMLASQTADLNHLAPSVVALTKGVAGAKYQTFGFDRQAAAQHNVACTMFFMAAIANQAGNGGKVDTSAAKDAMLLANLELKAIKGQEPSFTENLSRTRVKAFEITRPALTLADEEKIVLATTTIPFATTASVKAVSLPGSTAAHLKR